MADNDLKVIVKAKELAEFLSRFVTVLECPREVWDAMHKDGLEYAEAWLKWLKLPAKEN